MDNEQINVLLIEDNPGDARLVKEMLAEAGAKKFNLERVERVGEGLKRLGQDSFHVILLDLSLPDGNGLDTVDRVCNVAPHIPVLILTGLDDEILAIRAVQEGAQDYLVKGQMNSNLLMRALRYAIERKLGEEALRRSEEEAKRLAKENVIVAEIGRIISSTLDMEEVCERFAEELRKLIPFDRIAINIINPGHDTVTVA
jgi:DNA-binding response OmpR family regulator